MHVARSAIASWEARPERRSWQAHQVREYLVSVVAQELERNVPLIDSCDERIREQFQLAANQYELTTDLLDGFAVVLPEVGNGLEVRR